MPARPGVAYVRPAAGPGPALARPRFAPSTPTALSGGGGGAGAHAMPVRAATASPRTAAVTPAVVRPRAGAPFIRPAVTPASRPPAFAPRPTATGPPRFAAATGAVGARGPPAPVGAAGAPGPAPALWAMPLRGKSATAPRARLTVMVKHFTMLPTGAVVAFSLTDGDGRPRAFRDAAPQFQPLATVMRLVLPSPRPPPGGVSAQPVDSWDYRPYKMRWPAASPGQAELMFWWSGGTVPPGSRVEVLFNAHTSSDAVFGAVTLLALDFVTMPAWALHPATAYPWLVGAAAAALPPVPASKRWEGKEAEGKEEEEKEGGGGGGGKEGECDVDRGGGEGKSADG